MSEPPASHSLTVDEVQALELLMARQRSSAWTMVALLATFFVPIFSVVAFVGLYPPFWNPSLAQSVVGAATGLVVLFGLFVAMTWRPVWRLRADLRGGAAETREGEVVSCRRQDHVVTVALAEAPTQTLTLSAPVVGPDARGALDVGQHVRLVWLRHSGRLLSLQA